MKCIKSDCVVDKEVRHEALVLPALLKWVPVISTSRRAHVSRWTLSPGR